MKRLLSVFSLLLVISSCSHRIHRTGYSVKKTQYWDCDLPVKKDIEIDSTYKKVGGISFDDCKNSKIKTEEQVLTILKKEGCAIDAEFAIIIEENKNHTTNNCYQCKADYYVKKTYLVNNPDYGLSTAKKSLSPSQIAWYSVGFGLITTLFFLYTSIY